MITLIKKIFNRNKPQVNESETVTYVTPPQIDFSDIENEFSKRSYSFGFYRKQLSTSDPRLLHWIGSIDYYGYQREKSLNYLINNYTEGDENRILLRLEDWVVKIQKIAREWILLHFDMLSLEQINRQYRLILYLARKEKLSDDIAMKTINEVLIKKAAESKDIIFYKLDTKLRRYIYNLVDDQNPQFRKRILSDKDPFNRILLLKKYSLDELSQKEIEKLKTDKSSFVKRNFLYFLIINHEMPNQEDLTSFCMDENKGIREIAKFWLYKLYGTDPYNLYKEQTDDKRYFLADYAKKEDLNIFIKGFKSENRNVKYQCFKAICKIDTSLLKEMEPIKLLSLNRKFRELVCYYLPGVLPIGEIRNLKPKFHSMNSNGQLIYLDMIYKKSFWQFLVEALDILITAPTNENIKFIFSKYYQITHIYEKLEPQLKNDILGKMKGLSHNKDQHIKSLIEHINFIFKTM